MGDQKGTVLLWVQPDVLGQSLGDGEPDDIGREHQRPVLAEGKVGGGDERVVTDTGDAVQGIVPACLDPPVGRVSLRRFVCGETAVGRVEQISDGLQRLARGQGRPGRDHIVHSKRDGRAGLS